MIGRAGEAMNSLAVMYSALERHADALAMLEQVLKFFRRVLPANHPDIGEGCLGGMRCMRLDNCVCLCLCVCVCGREGGGVGICLV